MNRPREPLEHNFCQRFHPIVWVGECFQQDPLNPGWGFDESVGEPWPPGELVEMGLQELQLNEIPTTSEVNR